MLSGSARGFSSVPRASPGTVSFGFLLREGEGKEALRGFRSHLRPARPAQRGASAAGPPLTSRRPRAGRGAFLPRGSQPFPGICSRSDEALETGNIGPFVRRLITRFFWCSRDRFPNRHQCHAGQESSYTNETPHGQKSFPVVRSGGVGLVFL